MKNKLVAMTVSCSLLALFQIQFCLGENAKENAYTRTQFIKLQKFQYKAANIYEAVNYTMSLAVEQDPSLENVSIVIGPMTPRNKEKPQEQDITVDETLWNILRYWSELFNLHLKVKGNTLIFDEIRTQP